MYVHIGNNEILSKDDIVAIFDIKTIKESRQNLRIWNMLKVRNNSADQSVIIVQKDDNDENIIFSNIAVSTLKKRLEKDAVSYFPNVE